MTRTDNNRHQLDFTYYGDTDEIEAKYAKELIKAANRLAEKYHINVGYGEDTFIE